MWKGVGTRCCGLRGVTASRVKVVSRHMPVNCIFLIGRVVGSWRVTGTREIRHPCLSSRWREPRVRASLLADRPIRKIAILRQLCRETALTLDACLVQVTGTRRRDSAGTSFARAALLDFSDVVFSLVFCSWVRIRLVGHRLWGVFSYCHSE